VRAFNHCIDRGWAHYWGTSEWSARDIEAAVAAADRLGLVRPAVEQPEYSLVARQRVEVEYAPLLREHGLGLTTWSPLASGVLTGKYAGRALPPGSRLTVEAYRFLADEKLGGSAWQIDAAEALRPLAAELGCSLAQLAIAWCLSNPRVSSVLLGATTRGQLEENLGALAVAPRLTPALLARVAAAMGERAAPARGAVAEQVHGVRCVDAVRGEHVARAP
jgi:aryl-alcohol dehydrogenase-like predicted oxidoreductase